MQDLQRSKCLMKAAFSVWDKRISPVFDVSKNFLVLEIEEGTVNATSEVILMEDVPVRKISRLNDMNIEDLVCGAISRPLAETALAFGIKVFSFTAGDVEYVIEAYLAGNLSDPALSMPGCRRRRAHFQGGRCCSQDNNFSNREQSQFNQRSNVMPRGDGTGPQGQDPGTGTGKGRGNGQGRSSGGRGGLGQGKGLRDGTGQGRRRGLGSKGKK
jgi:predicted Fe-Mo cluster-binding NifX family protein